MNKKSKERSENRKALPKFFLTMLGALLLGGVIGFVIGFSRIFGLGLNALAGQVRAALEFSIPWGIPVSSLLTLLPCFFLYRAAAKKFAAWDGGDENEDSESIELLLSWVLLLSAVQLLVNLFFMSALGTYCLDGDGALWVVSLFILSCGAVVFAQQKTVDLERRMNPEKHGSVYDTKFQKKWLDSCDESERQQIGEASHRACMVTNRLCLGLWLILTLLGMVMEMSLLPVFVLLLVWGTMMVSYCLACIRLSKGKQVLPEK